MPPFQSSNQVCDATPRSLLQEARLQLVKQGKKHRLRNDLKRGESTLRPFGEKLLLRKRCLDSSIRAQDTSRLSSDQSNVTLQLTTTF